MMLPELRFRRLLVAVDDTPGAALALAAGVTVAQRDHAELTIVSIVPDLAATAARWPSPGLTPPLMQEDADAAVQKTLREAVDAVPDDIPVTSVFRRGSAGREIVALAQEGTYDAIILGARGVGRFGGAIAGSVSAYVMHHAKVAVFAAHAPAEAAHEPEPAAA